MPQRGLHFVVIGAQKAGTTTLFHHLRQHPKLALPPDKEAPFFSRPDLYPKGADWFIDHYFSGADADRLLGKVSPQYMCVPGTAARLASAFPQVKLVALLRDPVDRARSQHAMAMRKGLEQRPFADAVEAQLQPEALAQARSSGWTSPAAVADSYVVWGEYGRALAAYLDAFPREQLRVAFSAELAARPAAVVRDVQKFVGIEQIDPPTLGRNYHVGATEARSDLHRHARANRLARRLWHRLPLRYRNRISYEYWQWNIRASGSSEAPPPPETIAALRRHYWPDEELVERLLGVTVPWPRQQPVVS